jgi:predicted DsbA family dithiol-disulfide isomerase
MKQVAEERGFDLEAMENRFKKIAADAGLDFAPNPKVCNSRKAHELSVWATENHQGTAFHHAVFRANYVEGRDIGNTEVLADIAASLGLCRENAVKALTSGAYQNPVNQDWELSRQMGILAAPTFVIRPMKLVGAQSYEKMEQFVLQNSGRR